MSLHSLHIADEFDHVGRARVTFILDGFDCDPDEVSLDLSITPTKIHRKGDAVRGPSGEAIRIEKHNRWLLGTADVLSKDLNEHFKWLFRRLIPVRDKLPSYAQAVPALFSVLYESNYLYAGTGPVFDAAISENIALIGAQLGFDIYCLSEHVIRAEIEGD
jgi:hypothetical protein